MSATITEKIKNIGVQVIESEPLCRHTTFKIGGPAKYFCTVNDEQSLIALLSLLKSQNIPTAILGNGSNILASDSGFDGAIINLSGKFTDIELIDETTVRCYSGVKLSTLCKFALEHSLSGLEFAYGIPGTVGGAVYMNAGAYGSEIKDCIIGARHLDADQNLCEFSADELNLSYRSSVYTNSNCVILSADFKLCKGDKTEINQKMSELMDRRKTKQPLEYPSAGSVFKRPQGYFAGALIEQAGLKGFSIGGAQVSKKHAGFIINRGNATCEDVLKLVKHIQDTVFRQNGVVLECEIKKL